MDDDGVMCVAEEELPRPASVAVSSAADFHSSVSVIKHQHFKPTTAKPTAQ